MPGQGPGLRKNRATATKTVLHGDPVIEGNIPGLAFKNAPLTPFTDPSTPTSKTITVGEVFTIQFGGQVFIRTAVITGGLAAVPEGTRVYIVAADNSVTATAGTNVKFGVVDKVDTVRDGVYVNTNARDTF